MSIEDRTRWDGKHRRVAPLSPRASVLAMPRAASPSALALDLACGQGRHALALERAGYLVVAMDASRQALQRTVEAFDAAGPGGQDRVLPVQADADAWPFAAEAFHAIVQVDFLDRALFPFMAGSLRRGGLLLVDTFLDQGRPNAEGPSRPAFLLSPGELAGAFPGLHILRCDELRGDTARGILLARKP
jgi:SAM-dependent methyltransferase